LRSGRVSCSLLFNAHPKFARRNAASRIKTRLFVRGSSGAAAEPPLNAATCPDCASRRTRRHISYGADDDTGVVVPIPRELAKRSGQCPIGHVPHLSPRVRRHRASQCDIDWVSTWSGSHRAASPCVTPIPSDVASDPRLDRVGHRVPDGCEAGPLRVDVILAAALLVAVVGNVVRERSSATTLSPEGR
jgi:hypothetical protein